MSPEELQSQLSTLLTAWESECAEFKDANDNFSTSDIGKYFSALANEANLRGLASAWLVFGVNNKTHAVIGTAYRPEQARLHSLKHQIAQGTDPATSFREIHELVTSSGRVVLFEVPAAPRGLPIAWQTHFYARAGESLTGLSIAKQDEIRAQGLADDWSAIVVKAATISAKKKEQALARKEQEFRDLILKAYRAEPLPDAAFFHGKNGGRLVVVGPINLPVGRLFVEEVITECRKRGASRVDVLAFEFEMGLFPAVLDEAKHKGIDLAPKTIPPEVFDKRAVEKGQVRFHDVAYIEVTPRFDQKNKLAVAVELSDFSVYYSQGVVDAITADLKAGKSEVVCEAGKLVKFSKNKEGVITRDVLTKKWADWVDYWAVDFDYENRKEIIKVPMRMGVEGELPGGVKDEGEFIDFEERWTGAYIFENEWQSFRTRQNRDLELTSVNHTYAKPGHYTIAVKVIDIFGNDTMTLLPVTAG